MSVSRRGFLQGMLALGAALAILKVAPVMKLWTPPVGIPIHSTYSLGLNVDLYDFSEARAQAIMAAMRRTKEQVAFNVYNREFAKYALPK